MIKLLLLAVIPFMSEHRYVAPKTEVSTNFYGSVTGIVDKSYIDSLGVKGGVESVNGKTGAVELVASDVHALPDTYTPPVQPTDTNAVIDIANATIATNATITTLTSSVSTLTSSVSTLTSDVSSLTSNKLDKAGGEIRGDGDNTGVLKIIKGSDPYYLPTLTISGSTIEGSDLDILDLHYANGRVSYNELPEEGDMGSFMFEGAEHPIYANGVPVATINDLALKADEFTAWVPDSSAPALRGQPEFIEISFFWVWTDDQGTDWITTGGRDAVELEFRDSSGVGDPFTAIRTHVLRTGDAATPQELAEAISTNNPAFVSAVRSTPPDPATPWGTYGTLGAAIAGIIAALANKLTKGLSAQGVPTDANVQELFSESNTSLTGIIVAMIKTNAESAAEPTNTVTLNDNAPKTVTVATVESPATPSLAVTFGAARNGGLRICELYILNGTADTDLTFNAETVHFVSTGDSFPACEAGINYFVFAEVAANLWKVTRETMKSITTPTPVAAE